MKKILLIFLCTILTAACSGEDSTHAEGRHSEHSERWYTQEDVAQGKEIFQSNCAVCHGDNAQGSADWRKQRADGSYPPPPLNGTAHTWHHSIKMLKRSIRDGSMHLGGQMPAFKDRLSEKEIEQVIAYFQSKWSPKAYKAWKHRRHH